MSRAAIFRFRLYIAGDTQNSAHAIANLNAICVAHLVGRHVTEIVDVFLDPERALTDGIFMTPTLMKLSPTPSRRIIGTLSDRATVLQALGLDAMPA